MIYPGRSKLEQSDWKHYTLTKEKANNMKTNKLKLIQLRKKKKKINDRNKSFKLDQQLPTWTLKKKKKKWETENDFLLLFFLLNFYNLIFKTFIPIKLKLARLNEKPVDSKRAKIGWKLFIPKSFYLKFH